jgi:hypothetical protein
MALTVLLWVAAQSALPLRGPEQEEARGSLAELFLGSGDPISLPAEEDGLDLPRALSLVTEPLRTVPWELDFAVDFRGNQWAMFGASRTILSNGTRWNVKVDDALGLGGALTARLTRWSIQTYFDYDFGVLGTPDKFTVRSWGANLGLDLLGTESERFAVMVGPVLLYPELSLKEGGLRLPGRLSSSVGGQLGIRYCRDFWERHAGNPRYGFSVEAFFRYAPLRFQGDPGVENKSIGGAGILIEFGAYVRF